MSYHDLQQDCHVSSLFAFHTLSLELVATSLLAQQTGAPENYTVAATEAKELSDCWKSWQTPDRHANSTLFLVLATKCVNCRAF